MYIYIYISGIRLLILCKLLKMKLKHLRFFLFFIFCKAHFKEKSKAGVWILSVTLWPNPAAACLLHEVLWEHSYMLISLHAVCSYFGATMVALSSCDSNHMTYKD